MRTKMRRFQLAALFLLVGGTTAAGGQTQEPAKKFEKDHGEIMAELQRKEHVQAWQRYSLIGIPLVEKPPVIDGTVDIREWSVAACLGYALDMTDPLMVRDMARFFLCYSPTHLYLAFQFERPPNARQPSKKDFFEVLLDVDHGHQKYCTLAVNREELLWTGVAPGLDRSAWKPAIEFKSRSTHFGWEGEVAIPFKDFAGLKNFPGCQGFPQAGTIWGLDLIRNEQTPTARLAHWAWRKQWAAVKGLGHLVFLGQPVALRFEKVGWLVQQKRMGGQLEVLNFGNQPVNLDVALELRKARGRLDMPYYAALDSALTDDLGAAITAMPVEEIKRQLQPFDPAGQTIQKLQVPANSRKLVDLTPTADPGSYLFLCSVKENERMIAGLLAPFEVSVPRFSGRSHAPDPAR